MMMKSWLVIVALAVVAGMVAGASTPTAAPQAVDAWPAVMGDANSVVVAGARASGPIVSTPGGGNDDEPENRCQGNWLQRLICGGGKVLKFIEEVGNALCEILFIC